MSHTMPGPGQKGVFWEYYKDFGTGREWIKVWKEIAKSVPEGEPSSEDAQHFKKWEKRDDGTWVYDLWKLEGSRLILTPMESARLQSLDAFRRRPDADAPSRSRSPRGRGDELDLDQLQILSHMADLDL